MQKNKPGARMRCQRIPLLFAALALSGVAPLASCSVFRPTKHIAASESTAALDSAWKEIKRQQVEETATTVESATVTLNVPAGPLVDASAPLAKIIAGDSLTLDEGGVTASASYDAATGRVRLRARRKATVGTQTTERRTTATKKADTKTETKGRVKTKTKAVAKSRDVVKPGGFRWGAAGVGLLLAAVAAGAVWFWLMPFLRRRKNDGLAR